MRSPGIFFKTFILLIFGYYGLSYSAVKVVYPPDRVYVRVKKLVLVGLVDDPRIKKVKIEGVKVSGGKKFLPVKDKAFYALVELSSGTNRIHINTGKDSISIRVFYLKSPQQKKDIPKGFREFYVHKYVGLPNCKTCHRVKRGNYRVIIPTPAGCSNSKCHTNIGKAKYVHGPVGAKVCICCHNPHGSFLPKAIEREGGDLCYACHQAKVKEFSKGLIHPPVEEGDCTACHDPHQSGQRYQLRGKTLQDLCFMCHSDTIVKHKYLHGPVAVGDCVACHKPHSSPNEFLLIAPPKKGAVCFECHKERLKEFTRKMVHKPVAEDCNKCHDPHGSDYKAQLLQPQPKLCQECHKKLHSEVFQDIAKAKYTHKPVSEGHCTSCHTPHSSNFRSQLKNKLPDLCFSCHVDLGEYVKECKYYHGPVREGDCDACHKPHGSLYTKLLNKYFPPEFYTPYSEDKYSLCFECHNKDIAKDQRTKTLTNFRNGDENLHYLHVHRRKGRSCKACHDPHASVQPKHIRTEVPFGA